MTASYVSARFEKTDVNPSVPPFRCIVRNLDDGGVPPVPGPGWRPTSPDELRECFVLEYVNDTLGERFVRVADLADIAGLPIRALDSFEVPSANFVGDGVVPGDILEITPPNVTVWQSEEYTSSPYQFEVVSVVSATRLTLDRVIPSFLPALTWVIAGKSQGSVNGYPRRNGFPSVSSTFRDARMAVFFADVATLDAFVEATKAGLDALGAESTTTTLLSENYSSTAT